MRLSMRLLAALMVLGMFAAACGSDDTGDGTSAGSSTDGTTEVVEAEPDSGETAMDETEMEEAEDTTMEEAEAPAESTGVDAIEIMTRWEVESDIGLAFDEIASEYTAETGVAIDIIGQAGEELDVAYETALLGGKEPHLVIVNLFDRTTGWLAQDAVVDVNPYIDSWGLRDVIDASAVGEWETAEGAVQGFPYSGFAWPMWFNTALLNDAGITEVPTTVDDLIAASTALRANGVGPVVVGGSDWSGQKLFMQIAQMYLGSDAMKGLLQTGGFCANADAMRGIELFEQLRAEGVFIDDIEGFSADLMNETFYTQGAAIMPAGSWAFANTPPELVDSIALGGFPIPDGSAYDLPTVYQGFTGVGFMISPRGESEAIGELEDFLTRFYEESNYAKFVPANVVPAIQLVDTSVATDPLLQRTLAAEYNDKTDVALLMDVWVPPASNDGVGQAIALAYTGAPASEVCGLLDEAY